MKLTAEDFIEVIDEEELYKLKTDLYNGSVALKKMVDSKLKQLEDKKRGFCNTCGEDLLELDGSFTLLFGPEDFKKKVSFCAHDCLEYFLNEIKKRPEEKKL
ncbi:hypothetical protein HYY69_02350 [Candidatus Woesearchaeota archaeon]|nr:hypothetical protein [Candidatus Woesearchaeota archaeon]